MSPLLTLLRLDHSVKSSTIHHGATRFVIAADAYPREAYLVKRNRSKESIAYGLRHEAGERIEASSDYARYAISYQLFPPTRSASPFDRLTVLSVAEERTTN
jgi:hypothetical protein